MNINKLDTNGYWAVDGTPIYVPATPCKIEHSNIAGNSTGRDDTGIMHIDWVRRDVTKVFLEYKAITASELAYMQNLMQGKEFTFTYRDQGQTKTFNGYVGESSYSHYSYALGEEIYIDYSINVIEL